MEATVTMPLTQYEQMKSDLGLYKQRAKEYRENYLRTIESLSSILLDPEMLGNSERIVAISRYMDELTEKLRQ